MSTPNPRKRLPVRPSEEHLKKQAKRRAKADAVPLAAAQHRLAAEYGCRDWAELMRVVETMRRGSDQLVDVRSAIEPLPAAVRKRDTAEVRRLLAAGAFTQHDLDKALAHAAWYGGDAPDVLPVRKALFDLLIDHGADPHGQYGSAYGPVVFGTGECQSPDGLQWLIDAGCDVTAPPVDTKYGPQCALSTWLGSYLRGDNARKHRGIKILLAHHAFVPPDVTPPVLAIHRGDAARLAELIDADPSLATRRFDRLPYGQPNLHGATLLQAAADLGEIACVNVLLDRGAPINVSDDDGRTALHRAARHGPMELVERLLQHGAREWIADKAGKLPHDDAAANGAADGPLIVELLTRPVIRDPHFRAAVAALHAGDDATLRRLLADHPNLSRDRAVEPACYPEGYFGSPKLLWFVAFNPTLAETMPANIATIAETIIAAGVDPADLGYTLELVMTSDPAKQQGHRGPLTDLLLDHGATAGRETILSTLGHGERAAIEHLLRRGQPVTAAIAAGLGRTDALPSLLDAADVDERHDALSMSVINGHTEAARLCLAAGADANAPLRVHAHSTPLHHAAGNGMVDLMRLLLAHGANPTTRDTLWNATPRQWAEHEKHPEAAALLPVPSPGTPG